ncbi:APC family permease [Rhodococcus sp. NPDC057529]|uniref:APC family permease n=1 Tax=Rhodococcus sp. NPDC057529 TaxID=3346158 RepID=UPI0036728FCD
MSKLSDPVPADSGHPAGAEELDSGHLGRTQLVSLALASSIPAVGIAIVPMLLFSSVGLAALPAAVLSALAVISIGLAVIFFAKRCVATGSLYSYVGEVYGPWARYITGGALLVGFVVLTAALSGIIGIFFGSFLASLGMEGALSLGPQVAIYAGAIGIGIYVPFRGLDTSVRTAVVLAVISMPLVTVVTVASAFHTGLDLTQQFDFATLTPDGVLQGVAAGAAFLMGFESCAAMAAETRDPKRNIPLAVMSIPVVLGVIFIGCTLLQVPGLNEASDYLAKGMSPTAALALNAGLGTWVADATDLVLAAATFACLIGYINYGARFLLTLGDDGLLPEKVTSIHHKFRSPHVAISTLGILGFVTIVAMLIATGSPADAYNAIATLVVYVWVLPYLLIVSGTIVLLIKERVFRPVLIAACLFGGATMAWCFINGVVNPPLPPVDTMTWVALVVVPIFTAILVLNRTLSARRARASTN